MKRKKTRDDKRLQEVGERLRKARNQLGISQSEMAGRVGIVQSALVNYEHGRRTPPLSVLLALEHTFHIDHRWILEGKGEPLRRGRPLKPVIVAGQEHLRALQELEGADAYHAVPYMRDPAAAGTGLIMEEDIAGYCIIHQRVAPRPDDIRCVSISGDSMAPTLTDGSIVAVDITLRELRLVKGKIVCARTEEGEVVIKRLRLRQRHVLLYSDNPDQEKYPPLIVDLTEQPEPVIGQVVWAWVDLR